MSVNSVLFIQKSKIIPSSWIELLVDNSIHFKVINNSSDLSKIGNNPDVVVIDISHYLSDKFDTISWIKGLFPDSEIIILTSVEYISKAVDSIVYDGAYLYLPLPVSAEILVEVIKKAIRKNKEKSDLISYESDYFEKSLNSSKSMEKILMTVKKIAPTEASILVTGESGTGKEVLSKFIHSTSKRSKENFIAINAGAIPENLIESELFGHVKGAFTSAERDKKGLIEEADKGTLFLDEIGELPLNMQVKLLRFLQEKTFRRVGDTEERYSNVRIISATNRDLKKMISEGTFREDLYYRLNVFHINIPPLRERKESILNLINNFLIKYNAIYSKNVTVIEQGALLALAKYNFPGNIRELENMLEHAVVLADSNSIGLYDFPEELVNSVPIYYSPTKYITDERDKEEFVEDSLSNDDFLVLEDKKDIKEINVKTLKQLENEYINDILNLCNGNHTEAAKKLDISRATLWRKLKEKEQ